MVITLTNTGIKEVGEALWRKISFLYVTGSQCCQHIQVRYQQAIRMMDVVFKREVRAGSVGSTA